MAPVLVDGAAVPSSTEVVFDFVMVVVVAKVKVGVRRIELGGRLSMPDREEAAGEEEGTEVEGKVDCKTEEPVLVTGLMGVLEGAGECSLTEPPPGGLT